LDRGIEDNIALKVSLTSDESRRLKEVCDLAGVSDFKNSRAGDLKVGERGKRLSGGQQKRLGIARALFRQPSVLVLDEPTAGLDRFARDQIIDTIKKLTGSITIILVTHQTELVEICDCVYELE
jgi:ABC-type bacteriocin/lantibiotic exporter with double-glycine peptidase domain